MYHRLSWFIARSWSTVVLLWLGLVVLVRLVAPSWTQVTRDGDLAYLPPHMASVVGERLLDEAFAEHRGKSQFVFVFARASDRLERADLELADRAAARFFNQLGAHWLQQAREAASRLRLTGLPADGAAPGGLPSYQEILGAFDEALRLDEDFTAARQNRALAAAFLAEAGTPLRDRDLAFPTGEWRLRPEQAADLPLVDVWTRHTDVIGAKLHSSDGHAVLVVLQVRNEFMATDNIRIMNELDRYLAEFRGWSAESPVPGLSIGLSGTAAVGGDMLRAALESIQNTELFTVGLVVAILLLVYRAPLMVLVPVVTIGTSLLVGTGLVALLTQLNQLPGFTWWDFKIFKTTRIFIVVLLYGSGTDFCLFLMARYREQLQRGESYASGLAKALHAIGGAVTASACTTILGLSMMAFAEFGKYRNSGPAIAVCLAVTLLACLTLAPALVRGLGPVLFWPFGPPAPADGSPESVSGRLDVLWQGLSRLATRYPGGLLAGSLLLLAPLGWHGYQARERVTYDLLSELPDARPSKAGSELLKRHFPIGEGGPVMILARRPEAGFGSEDRQRRSEALAAVFALTQRLAEVPGVHAVRSWAEPLGDPPRTMSLASSAGRRKLALQTHRLTQAIYLAQRPPFRGEVTKLEAVLEDSPFSLASMETFERIDKVLRAESARSDSFWTNAQFSYAGTTAGIYDLRQVTRQDNRRIEWLVTAAVLGVLLALLRRPLVCLFMIGSVVLTYFVTMGLSDLLFAAWYPERFEGLDWKTPLFLFVILVAVGVDYNIYLMTRVIEEQQRLGRLAGLRAAMVRTGGIITSCGVIMAATFVSMMSGSLLGMVELGFALSLGILLDTFLVRTLLLPAFLALGARRSAAP